MDTFYIGLYCYITLLLMSKPTFYMSMAYNITHLKFNAYDCMWFISDCLMDGLYSVIVQIFIMGLVI